ncbi:MAG: HAMP domain-containing histidine kinase [Eubacterium sp.]|nr:HAMP domain-containing histidine kinase [Eubacterium sp.]
MKVARRKEFIKSILLPGVLILLAVCILICIIGAKARVRLRDDQRTSDYELAGLVHEEYPEVSGYDLIRIVKYRNYGQTADTDYYEQGRSLLEEYGYDDLYVSKEIKAITGSSILFGILVAVCGMGLYALIVLRVMKKKSDEVAEVTGYIHNLNDRKYDLMLSDNTENELSLLRNEIYKTTVILKEIAEDKVKETERLSESLADISHQLRTPLTSMSLMIDNICDDEEMPDELRREFLTDIQSEVTWMSSLVNSLLILAKFDAGTIVMKEEEIDADELLQESVKRLGVLLELHGVSVVWGDGTKLGEKAGTGAGSGDSAEKAGGAVGAGDGAEKAGGAVGAGGGAGKARDAVGAGGGAGKEESGIRFKGDKKWQLEAVSNIIKNCAEHTPEGGHIHLSVEQNSIYTKITVRDEGEGMNPEDMRHIFERFYKAQNARPESIGIGLSLAKSIVETQKGYITVDSEPGKGSTFEIRYMTARI